MALKVVSSLAKKGVLDRVGHGVYLVRPLRAIGRPWAISAFVAVEQSLLGTPHYIGGLGALGIHRLSEQIYSSVVDVFSPTYKPPQILASAKIRFHRMPENEIPIGKMTVLVEHLPIHVSDPERTLVDALNHPQAFGGVGEGEDGDHAKCDPRMQRLLHAVQRRLHPFMRVLKRCYGCLQLIIIYHGLVHAGGAFKLIEHGPGFEQKVNWMQFSPARNSYCQ